MILSFGKFKGQHLESTPDWYKNWLKNQKWFQQKFMNKATDCPTNAYKQLKGWNGYSKNGQAAYDRIFEFEKEQALKQDCYDGICTCCQHSMYYGM